MHKAGIASGDIPHDTPVLTTDGSYHPIATSLHVVRPFLFPRYYPDEWLQFIRPENIRVTLEFRETESGALVDEFPLVPKVYAHPTRDVAVMFADLQAISNASVSGENRDLDIVAVAGRVALLENCYKFKLATDEGACSPGDELAFGGHLLNTEPHEEDCVPLPAIVTGTMVRSFPPPQELILAETEVVLQPGMCGGPVVNQDGACVGMIEGVVQNAAAATIDSGDSNDEVRDGMAAVMPASVVESLLLEAIDGRGGERHHPPHDDSVTPPP